MIRETEKPFIFFPRFWEFHHISHCLSFLQMHRRSHRLNTDFLQTPMHRNTCIRHRMSYERTCNPYTALLVLRLWSVRCLFDTLEHIQRHILLCSRFHSRAHQRLSISLSFPFCKHSMHRIVTRGPRSRPAPYRPATGSSQPCPRWLRRRSGSCRRRRCLRPVRRRTRSSFWRGSWLQRGHPRVL